MSYSLIKVGKIWHYRYQIGNERVQRSTRETGKRIAQDIAFCAFADAKKQHRNEQTIPTLTQLIDAWVDLHTHTLSDHHVRSVLRLKRLYMYGMGSLLITDITTERVEAARLMHMETHSRASVNQWHAILRLLTNWAVKRKIIEKPPFSVPMLKLQKKPRPTMSTAFAARWLAVIDESAHKGTGVAIAVRLMFGLGLRETEALGARWEWIDWGRATYTPGKTKGREADPVPMPAWLVEFLHPYKKTTGHIVLNRRGHPARPGFARLAIRRANDRCGLTGITPHRLRGSFATLLSEHGVPIQTIQAVMRHKDPKTTLNYLEKNMDLAVRAQKSIAVQSGITSAFTPKRNR